MERGGDRKSEKIKGSNDPLISDQLTIEQAADLMNVSIPTVKRAKARMKNDMDDANIWEAPMFVQEEQAPAA